MTQTPSVSEILQSALTHRSAGRLHEAEMEYLAVLSCQNNHPAALHGLGVTRHLAGRQDEAIELLGAAVRAAPRSAAFRCNLAAVLGHCDRHAEAIIELRHAIALKPDCFDAWRNLAIALEKQCDDAAAEMACRRLIELRPGEATGRHFLGRVLNRLKRIEEGRAALQEAVRLDPSNVAAWEDLEKTQSALGDLNATISCRRQLVGLKPGNPEAGSSLLYALQHDCDQTPADLFAEHLKWAKHWSIRFTADGARHVNGPESGRKLRLGYVSADFNQHPTGRFLEPVLTHHDRDRFEVYCYSDVTRPDEATRRMRGVADCWRQTAGVSHRDLANLVRGDEIDVLFDTTGHMANNRLPTFMLKPAPLQVSLAMYPGTTGVDAIDYFVTDAYHDPPGMTEGLYVEKLIRLSPSARCYRPDDSGPDPVSLGDDPARRIVFGAFNRIVKVSDATIRLWSEIIARVPNSQLQALVPGFGGDRTPACIRARFSRCGLAEERVRFMGRTSRRIYLERLANADVCLDTFPYNGCTTTCDSLWMGTPVVSLAGKSHVSRAGLSILSQVGLQELVAEDPSQYVEKVIALVRDRSNLQRLRSGLRKRMLQSPLTDGRRFARQLEDYMQAIQISRSLL